MIGTSGAAALVGLVGCGGRQWRSANSAGRQARITRDWQRDGLAGVAESPVTISKSANAVGEPEHIPSISGDSLRISSTAAHVDGNRREVWTISDEIYTDVEVLARIDPPSEIGGSGMTPQVGLILRLHDNEADSRSMLNVDNNIYTTFGPVNFGRWTSTDQRTAGTTGLTLGDNRTIPLASRSSSIISRTRTFYGRWFDTFGVSSGPGGFEPGDKVDIESTEPGWSRSAATVIRATDDGQITVASPAGASESVPLTLDVGSITLTSGTYRTQSVTPRRHFPAWVRVRIVRSTLAVKWWLDGTAEPPVFTSLDLSGDPDLPSSGKIGLLANHLHGAGNYVTYGPVEIVPLETL